MPVLALPCASRSTSSTFLPTAASAVARLIAVVVLPTPPFWLARATTRARPERAASGAGLLGWLASSTGNFADPEDGCGGVGDARHPLDAHPPIFGRLGQFLVRLGTLRKDADGRF